MTPDPTSVFLIESSAETRALVARYLDGSDLIRVVGTAADPSGAMAGIEESDPDVVVVDRFPGSDLRVHDRCLVIHATTVPGRTASELRRAGICAVVFKEVGMLDRLIAAVVEAAGRRPQP